VIPITLCCAIACARALKPRPRTQGSAGKFSMHMLGEQRSGSVAGALPPRLPHMHAGLHVIAYEQTWPGRRSTV
jgi:hypothetical protein